MKKETLKLVFQSYADAAASAASAAMFLVSINK